jgi:hypothetical protein
MIETPSVNQLLRTAGYYCVLGKENGSMNQLSPSKYIPDVLGFKKKSTSTVHAECSWIDHEVTMSIYPMSSP